MAVWWAGGGKVGGWPGARAAAWCADGGVVHGPRHGGSGMVGQTGASRKILLTHPGKR